MKTFTEFVNEAKGIEGLKRKVIPGYGMGIAKDREDREYSKAQSADLKGNSSEVDRKERTADRYARVAMGLNPFRN